MGNIMRYALAYLAALTSAVYIRFAVHPLAGQILCTVLLLPVFIIAVCAGFHVLKRRSRL